MSSFKIEDPTTWKCPQCESQPVHHEDYREHIALFLKREQTDVKCDGCMEDLVAETSGDTVEFVEEWNYV